jgi:WD40 repeat protein
MALWDRARGQELWRVQDTRYRKGNRNYYDTIGCIAFCPDSRRLLSGGKYSGHLSLWDVAGGKEVRRVGKHPGGVSSLVLSRDGRRALSGGRDKTVRLWDVQNGKELRRFVGHTDEVMAVALSPDGRHALSCSLDQTLRLWDVATGRELAGLDAHPHPDARPIVNSLAISPDGRRALCGTGSLIVLLDIAKR